MMSNPTETRILVPSLFVAGVLYLPHRPVRTCELMDSLSTLMHPLTFGLLSAPSSERQGRNLVESIKLDTFWLSVCLCTILILNIDVM